MGRQPCCDKVGLKRGPWTIDEDQKLISFILNNGIHCWRLVPKLAGLLRCGKSCRLRWTNYLRPDLKRGEFSEAEEDQIIQLHSRLGNRWSKIASHFPGRTDNEIKNHWNTRIKKRLKLLGLDPLTHKPIQHPDQKNHEAGLNITEDHGEEDKSVEVAESKDDEERRNGDVETGLDEDGIDVWESLDVDEMKLSLEVNSSSNSSSSSASLEFSLDGSANLKTSADADSSNIKGSNLSLGENIDYFPSWEALYYLEDLEDVLSFVNYP